MRRNTRSRPSQTRICMVLRLVGTTVWKLCCENDEQFANTGRDPSFPSLRFSDETRRGSPSPGESGRVCRITEDDPDACESLHSQTPFSRLCIGLNFRYCCQKWYLITRFYHSLLGTGTSMLRRPPGHAVFFSGRTPRALAVNLRVCQLSGTVRAGKHGPAGHS